MRPRGFLRAASGPNEAPAGRAALTARVRRRRRESAAEPAPPPHLSRTGTAGPRLRGGAAGRMPLPGGVRPAIVSPRPRLGLLCAPEPPVARSGETGFPGRTTAPRGAGGGGTPRYPTPPRATLSLSPRPEVAPGPAGCILHAHYVITPGQASGGSLRRRRRREAPATTQTGRRHRRRRRRRRHRRQSQEHRSRGLRGAAQPPSPPPPPSSSCPERGGSGRAPSPLPPTARIICVWPRSSALCGPGTISPLVSWAGPAARVRKPPTHDAAEAGRLSSGRLGEGRRAAAVVPSSCRRCLCARLCGPRVAAEA